HLPEGVDFLGSGRYIDGERLAEAEPAAALQVRLGAVVVVNETERLPEIGRGCIIVDDVHRGLHVLHWIHGSRVSRVNRAVGERLVNNVKLAAQVIVDMDEKVVERAVAECGDELAILVTYDVGFPVAVEVAVPGRSVAPTGRRLHSGIDPKGAVSVRK